MNAEANRVMKTEVWRQLERRIINGVYPLRRLLGSSDHSAVFLTEYRAENVPEVAIKLIPVDTLQTQAQLVLWGTAATLSHPNLLRLYDVGRWQLGSRAFLYVVMEHAEQTLAEILPKRPLTADEVGELLAPTLDALGFLHRNYLVHGQLKPSNFLVVKDQLKLASDTIRPIGNALAGIVAASAYDPPELKEGTISPASDVWGLGITLVEALTQRTLDWRDDRAETASLLAAVPPPFIDTVFRCLSRNPTHRPTINELEAQYKAAPPPEAEAPPVLQPPPAQEAPHEASPPGNTSKTTPWLSVITIVLLAALAIWIGLRFVRQPMSTRQSASDTLQDHSPPPDTRGVSASETSAPIARSPREAAPSAAAAAIADRSTTLPPAAAGTAGPDRATAAPGVADNVVADHTTSTPADAGRTASDHTASTPADTSRAASSSAEADRASVGHAAGTSSDTDRASVGHATSTPADTDHGIADRSVGAPVSASRAVVDHTGTARVDAARPVAKPALPSYVDTAPAVARSAGSPSQPPQGHSPAVLHQVMPEVSPAIRDKIRGTIKVTVRVLVDPSGNVVGEMFENAGPSRYFARLAGGAAEAWKFTPSSGRGPRVWQLHFEFTRSGDTVNSTAAE